MSGHPFRARRVNWVTSSAKYGIPMSGRASPVPYTFCVSFFRGEASAPDSRGMQPYNHAAFLAQMIPVSFHENGSGSAARDF